MTAFETASLALAEKQYWLDLIYTVISGAALIAAIWGGYVIYGQLRSARWMSLITLEQDMANRRDKFLNIKDRLANETDTTAIAADYGVQKENYLNSLERLASSVLNGNFPEKEMKQDYREYITGVVREFPDEFMAGTSYRKILKLYEKWQD